jgi:hypothetical protein
MGSKSGTRRGRYITKIGFLDVRAIDTTEKGTNRGKFSRPRVSGTELIIYHGKKVIARGLKSMDEVISKSKEHMGTKYCEIYNL